MEALNCGTGFFFYQSKLTSNTANNTWVMGCSGPFRCGQTCGYGDEYGYGYGYTCLVANKYCRRKRLCL